MGTESSGSGGIVQVNGAAVYVEEHGRGAPLILLHGGLGSGAMWQPLLPHLSDGCRVIVPDSRGHGRSTNPSGTLSYPQLADDVAALCEALRVHRPTLFGYSDGGQVALEFGVRHPDLADALIVAGAHPDFDASGLREIGRTILGGR